MTESVSAARQQVERKQELLREQIAIQEEYDRHAYRLETFEIQLRMIQEELDDLESAGLKSMLIGLFKDKQSVIDQKREAFDAAEQEHHACELAAEELRVRLENLSDEVAALANCEAVYEERLRGRAEELARDPGKVGEEYRALAGSGEAVREHLRKLGKAIEMGEYLVSSLSTARMSTRRAASKRMLGGVSTAGLYNTILSQACKVSEQGANTSLCNFKQALEEVIGDLAGNLGPEEQQLLEAIQTFQQQSAVLAMDDTCAQALEMDTSVSELTSQLNGIVKQREQELEALEQHRCALVERLEADD